MLHAQTTLSSTFKLDNGATVLYQTFSQVDLNDPARNFGTVRASGNTIDRNMRDGANRTLLGFQLGIERLPGDPIRFRLTMGPQGGWGFFGQSAPPREIQNGDRVLLDVTGRDRHRDGRFSTRSRWGLESGCSSCLRRNPSPRFRARPR